MALDPRELEIIHDYDLAVIAADELIVSFLMQATARGQMIQNAARKFSQFLELPESSSLILGALDFAWGVITLSVPALKLVKVVRADDAVSAVLKFLDPNNPPGRYDHAIEVAKNVREHAENTVKTYQAGREALKSNPPGLEQLEKLDGTKGPIKELVANGRDMVRKWRDTRAFLADAKHTRLQAAGAVQFSRSLQIAVKERLPAPEMFSSEELDQLEAEYLWQMIAYHVKRNVTMTKSKIGAYQVDGLNDTQRQTIVDLFGSPKSGRYYSRPGGFYVEIHLLRMGAAVRELKVDLYPARHNARGNRW